MLDCALKLSIIICICISITIHSTHSSLAPKSRAIDVITNQKSKLTIGQSIRSEDVEPQAVCARCALVIVGVYCICNSGEFDIVEQITNISRELDNSNPGQPKQFLTFTLYDGIITEFPENSFLDMQFENLVIENPINLQRIHTNAFNSTALYTNDTVRIWGDQYGGKNFSLRNEPPEYDLWAAFSSLANIWLLEITLGANEAHEIPDNAFRNINGPQNNLVEIRFIATGYHISRIGAYAFSQLPNMTDGIIDFSYTPVDHISPHAFDFNTTSDRYVNVDMRHCSLTADSFDAGSFIGRNRPLRLDLSHNNIRYIRQEVFYDFFDGDHRSVVYFDDNPLNCSDTEPFEWLLLSPIRNEYMARIVYPYCENGTELWHIDVGTPSTPPTSCPVVTCPSVTFTTPPPDVCTCPTNPSTQTQTTVAPVECTTPSGTTDSTFSYQIVFANLIFLFGVRVIY